MQKIAVIGAGVIGGFVARELARYNFDVTLIEKGVDVCSGASRANSGIVHGGFDAAEGSLKAKFNVLGNNLMPSVCKELGVKYKNNGSLVLSYEDNPNALIALKNRGESNGVKGLKILEREKILEIEPNISGEVKYALYAPTGGIVCPYNLTFAAIGNAMDNGVKLLTNFEVVDIKSGFTVIAKDGRTVTADYIINCAGGGSQKIANIVGDYSFKIGYRKGEYMLLDNSTGGFAKQTLFTLPTKAGKGVLVSPTVDGNTIVGPTSIEEDEYDVCIRQSAFDEIKENASKMCKNLPFNCVITSFAGVRAYCDRHDFVIEESKVDGLYNVAGIESPGLTASPAIGKFVAEFVANKLGAKVNEKFNPYRKPSDYFKTLSDEEKNEVIKKRPEYGKIICRCESVTLGEILDAMRTNPKATTIDGIKLRTRAGMGRCQSGFCQPSVLETIVAEYGIPFDKVSKNGGNSQIITGGEK